MKPYGLNELREMFLSYFESKDHLRLPSFSLIPQGDKSLLLIAAGMAPMKPWFQGEEEPPRRRVVTCQKCVRTNDIENVGKTARHGTYFEMLGNFSFGDYFKREAIGFTWEFLTSVLEMDANLLYPSVYVEDDEAYNIWRDEIGVAADHIVRLGKDDNFWELGQGPCGPCSEVYYDRGAERGCGSPDCAPGCDCDRYVEIWNNVFTQFDNDGEGNYSELKQKNIDTGMGLERLAVVCQNVDSLFDVDTLMRITQKISEITHAKYGETRKTDVSLRIITDHIRAGAMLIADGVLPSNEGRGYILRRLLRRAARHGRLLGVKEPFLHEVCETVVQVNEGAYPELRERAAHVLRVVITEEENFNKTLDSGLQILETVFASVKDGCVSGEDAFRLYDTYGFPIDLTAELAEERGFTVDTAAFDELMERQRERARTARQSMGDVGWESIDFGADKSATVFTGYETLTDNAKVTALVADGKLTAAIGEGEYGAVVLDRTPFYAETGGQTGDTGTLTTKTATFTVTDTQKTKGGKYLHHGCVTSGSLTTGDAVTAEVDIPRRNAVMRAHSATHLLQSALRTVLGNHITQAGSLVEPDKLRFDFTHYEAATSEQLARVEQIVNDAILSGASITAREMSLDDAKKDGATALFGEKYGDTVRVVTMSGWSKELCGGTHLDNTAKAGSFRIKSEFSVASGVRRIEAVTGLETLNIARTERENLAKIASSLKSTADEIPLRLDQLQSELRELRRTAASATAKEAVSIADGIANAAKNRSGFAVAAACVATSDPDEMRKIGDAIRDKNPAIVALLANATDGKITFLAVCGKDAVAKGAHAGNIVKTAAKIAGGSGGGKPESAMGGGKDESKLAEALESVYAAF